VGMGGYSFTQGRVLIAIMERFVVAAFEPRS
jgi:hypothetical protein